jgi:hypothetical protein
LSNIERLKKLAASIDLLAAKDEAALLRYNEIAAQRRSAAAELHRICSAFVERLNAHLKTTHVALDPREYGPDNFVEDAPNLLQINARGRIIQIEFGGTEPPVSTEEFRIPYILQGEIRGFNQELLDRQVIEEHLLFYCLERNGPMWRFFEARTYRSGPFDQGFLIDLMEQLV